MHIVYLNYLYDRFGVSVGSTIKAIELMHALQQEGHQIDIYWRKKEGGNDENPRKTIRQFLKKHFSKYFQEINQILQNSRFIIEERNLFENSKRPDLLISRLHPYLFSPFLIAKRLGVPHIIEADCPAAYEVRHFYPEYFRHPSLLEYIELKMIRHADRAFCVSNQLKKYFVSRGIEDKKIEVITNGVDVARFNPKINCRLVQEKYQLQKKTVVGFVGSFHYWHGVENLIRLIKAIVSSDSRIAFMMIGHGGALKSDLDRFIRERNLEDQVFCTGFVPHEEIPVYINAMDIVVAPYPPLDFFYYSPVKIYEYMACGKSVVTTRMGQITELIEHGKTGFLCDPGDIEALIDTVQRLIRNREMRAAIGRNAAGFIAGAHTWQHKARQLSVLCEEVLMSNNRMLTI
jgi:glycosyltransferase involved in cell wall biosynthesis